MNAMKKTFPCGHTGLGQYCHRCKARDDAYEKHREVKRAERAMLADATNVGVDMSGLPKHVAMKAADMIRKLKDGASYTDFHGKRLLEWGRNMISIPMGWSYRILCRDSGDGVAPIAVLSHEQYNIEISKAKR